MAAPKPETNWEVGDQTGPEAGGEANVIKTADFRLAPTNKPMQDDA